jgi:hypothetical protein
MRQIMFLFSFIVLYSVLGQSSFGQSASGIENPKTGKQPVANYTYKITPAINNTWCYDIFIDRKMFIHQTSIPGLPGNEGFKTKSDAEKVARLVIEKLKNGEMPPSVTADEMKNLKILLTK